jgi:hypothetical protein
MADTGGGKAAFRAAKKGEGKCQRSAACLPLTNTMLDVRGLPARVSAFSSGKLVHLAMKHITAVLLDKC